jgi:cell wall-associated protease
MKLLTLLMTLAFISPAHATIIAVIDSGTDLKHKDLVNKAWVNPIDIDDGVDNDDNGYIDDINGWNFADNNNKIIDYSFLGTFPPEDYQYFAWQTLYLKGTATSDQIAWLRKVSSDPKFIAGLETFANFIHGTHVAGLSAKNNDAARLMIIKLIATKSPLSGGGNGKAIDQSNPLYQYFDKAGLSEKWIKAGLKLLASQQGKAMAPIGKYVNEEHARVANCSFGTSTTEAKSLLAPILKLALKRDPTDAEVLSYSIYFVSQVVLAAHELTDSAKNTLFVIAAGNDGADNDSLPASPANIKTDNTISVAATMGYSKLASFSDYGATMVEVAAPGVGILSTIPGNLYMTVSGTSQATPFVTNIAGLALDANPSLSNSDVKKIIMDTSDTKAFLKGMVVSSGIANTARAMMAASLSKSMQLTDAIASARLQVNDVNPDQFQFSSEHADEDTYIMPLVPMFY